MAVFLNYGKLLRKKYDSYRKINDTIMFSTKLPFRWYIIDPYGRNRKRTPQKTMTTIFPSVMPNSALFTFCGNTRWHCCQQTQFKTGRLFTEFYIKYRTFSEPWVYYMYQAPFQTNKNHNRRWNRDM